MKYSAFIFFFVLSPYANSSSPEHACFKAMTTLAGSGYMASTFSRKVDLAGSKTDYLMPLRSFRGGGVIRLSSSGVYFCPFPSWEDSARRSVKINFSSGKHPNYRLFDFDSNPENLKIRERPMDGRFTSQIPEQKCSAASPEVIAKVHKVMAHFAERAMSGGGQFNFPENSCDKIESLEGIVVKRRRDTSSRSAAKPSGAGAGGPGGNGGEVGAGNPNATPYFLEQIRSTLGMNTSNGGHGAGPSLSGGLGQGWTPIPQNVLRAPVGGQNGGGPGGSGGPGDAGK